MNATKTNILVGVTGGIAAYKTCELIRLLRKQGYNVRVAMTNQAQQFVTPLSLQSLSGHPVFTDLFAQQSEAAMDHISLARWAELIIIAPASANFIAKYTHGIADDLLTTICLASQADLMLIPAMNQQMWLHPATQNNIRLLQQRHVTMLGPDNGEQACGEIGAGRMLEPELIINYLKKNTIAKTLLNKKHVVITAGPTIELIDPVRYFSNHSSGKMGYALAAAANKAGAKVTLISGKTQLTAPAGVTFFLTPSAAEMHRCTLTQAKHADIVIGCAAVCDYRILNPSSEKLKKTSDQVTLTLVKNPDIIADVAKLTPKPFTVGFAAEGQHLKTHAQQKLMGKNLDLICANLINQENAGFAADTNEIWAYWPGGEKHFLNQSKALLAEQLIELIAELLLALPTNALAEPSQYLT